MRHLLLGLLACTIGCDLASTDAEPDDPDPAAEVSDVALATNASPAGASCTTSSSCEIGLKCVANECTPPASTPMVGGGAHVLAAMQVWTVVWPGDEIVGAQVDRFTNAYLHSTQWTDSVGEYGVGTGAGHGVVVLDESPPATIIDTDGSFYGERIRAIIGKTASTGQAVPAPGTDSVFLFVVPAATHAPGGYYHSESASTLTSSTGGSIYVPYIAVRQDHVGFVSDKDYLTWSSAHELAETATDPRNGGVVSSWLRYQGEVADLCNDIPITESLGGTSYAISRVYSAARATARSEDPCVPALPGPYHNIALLPGRIAVPSGTAGVKVRLVPFAYGAPQAMAWHLYPGPGFHVTPNHGTSSPGDSVLVTVTRTATAHGPQLLQVWLDSAAHPNIPTQEWFGALTVGQ